MSMSRVSLMVFRTALLLLVLVGGTLTAIPSATADENAESGSSSSSSDELVPQTAEANLQSGLQTLDWIIIAAYAIGTIALGVFYSRRQETTEDYFVGGGNINPLLIGISLFATLLSTISYLSMPGEALGKGPVHLLGLLSLPLVFLIVAYGFLPAYMNQRVTSAYELLEDRLGLSVRLLGASLFLFLRLVWMTLLVYLAAKAMSVMMGVDLWVIDTGDWSIQSLRAGDAGAPEHLPSYARMEGSKLLLSAIPVIVAFTGFVSIIYTTLGGLRAVVITDFMQTVLLFGGALLVIGTVTWNLGGFGWFPTEWQDNWDTQPVFSTDPRTRVTVVGSVLALMVWYVGTSAGDQTSVQRFMATRDASAARRAYATQLIVAVIISLTLYTVGFALLGYFKANSDALPADLSLDANADDMFPRYIAYHLPVGISGLVVAALFAAGMSSIDSGVNSITAVVTTDFMQRLGWHPKSEKAAVRTAQYLALLIGVAVVLGSALMKHVPGNITAVTGKTVNLPTVPIFCLFVFALFVPFAKPAGVWAGAIFGTLTAALIAFSGPLVVYLATHYGVDPQAFGVELLDTGEKLVTAVREADPVTGESVLAARDPISFQWMGPSALVVNMVIGVVVSLLVPGGRRDSATSDSTGGSTDGKESG